jgi:hypothetical protein
MLACQRITLRVGTRSVKDVGSIVGIEIDYRRDGGWLVANIRDLETFEGIIVEM